jgi:hypothetical protein
MENRKNVTKKDSINESSIEKIYTQLFGEYQPDEFSPNAPKGVEHKTKESDMGEGKLFTKFLTNRIK